LPGTLEGLLDTIHQRVGRTKVLQFTAIRYFTFQATLCHKFSLTVLAGDGTPQKRSGDLNSTTTRWAGLGETN
jgi:hypothetical protein